MPGYAVFTGVSLLAALGLFMAIAGHAGPDPAKWLLHRSGLVALIFLVVTIAAASLRRVLSLPVLLQWRRALGLASFFFATSHVVVYATVFQGLDVSAMVDDVSRRPYIMIGMLCWLLLVPLAMTSTRTARRRLGPRWFALHRVVYVVVVLAILHQGMAQKADLALTLLFGMIVAALLLEKFLHARSGARHTR